FRRVLFRSKPQPKQKEIEAMPVATVPQPVEITGTVQDTAGNFLTGVTVQVVGNPQLGSATDINGRFVLAAPADATLVFSYLGFQEQRSEEHTSELQSRENLVCRLLLE